MCARMSEYNDKVTYLPTQSDYLNMRRWDFNGWMRELVSILADTIVASRLSSDLKDDPEVKELAQALVPVIRLIDAYLMKHGKIIYEPLSRQIRQIDGIFPPKPGRGEYVWRKKGQ